MNIQARLIQGERAALEKVYRLYFKKVFSICRRYSGEETLASDLAQEVFLKLWRNRENISPDLPMEQQLFVLSKNLVLDHLRKKLGEEKMLREYPLPPEDSLAGDEEEEKQRQLQKLTAAIRLLPEKQREVFEMSRFQGLTYDEIAAELGISRHTVSSHFSMAMKFLKKHLQLGYLMFLLS